MLGLEQIRALSAMLPQQRFTTAEIAAATKIAPGTVYKIVERAKKRGLIEQIDVRPRAPGSAGGGPEFIYRIVPGERARQLGTELEQSMRALLGGAATQSPGAAPEQLLIAENKLSHGLSTGAMAIRSAYDADNRIEMHEAAEDFVALFGSIGPELASAARAIETSSPLVSRLDAARDAFDQAKIYIGAPGHGNQRRNEPLRVQEAEVAAFIGASHAASVAASQDPFFAGGASLRWGGRLAHRLIDEFHNSTVPAHYEGIRMANRFMRVAGPTAAPKGVVIVDGIGDTNGTASVMRDALKATGVRIVGADEYSADDLFGCRVVVVGPGDASAKMAAALPRAAADGAVICIVDETGGARPAVPPQMEYFSLAGATPGESARKLFDTTAAVRTELCAPLVPPCRHNNLFSFRDFAIGDGGSEMLAAGRGPSVSGA
jgi:predicted transcriptional regulator